MIDRLQLTKRLYAAHPNAIRPETDDEAIWDLIYQTPEWLFCTVMVNIMEEMLT